MWRAAVDGVEDVRLAGRQVDAAQRDRDDLGARKADGLAPLLEGPVLARADQQARAELAAADDQGIVQRTSAARRTGAVGAAAHEGHDLDAGRRRPAPPRSRSGAGRRPDCARPPRGRRRSPWSPAGPVTVVPGGAVRISPLTVRRSSFMCGSQAYPEVDHALPLLLGHRGQGRGHPSVRQRAGDPPPARVHRLRPPLHDLRTGRRDSAAGHEEGRPARAVRPGQDPERAQEGLLEAAGARRGAGARGRSDRAHRSRSRARRKSPRRASATP